MKTIEIIQTQRRLGEKGDIVQREDRAAQKWIDLGYAKESKGASKTVRPSTSSGDDNNPDN